MGIGLQHFISPACVSVCAAVVLAASACGGSPALAHHLSSGCGDGRRIAITFDDGPHPPYTQQILDVVTSHGATATFFDEGEAVTAHPEIARAEVTAGAAVESHSFGHSPDLPSMSHEAFAEDLRRAELALREALGYTPALYRPPFGHTSNTMLEELHKAGYVSIGWDLDSRDWSDASVDEIVSSVLDHAHPGAIVLMHDGGLGGGNPDRSKTIAALPRVLDGLKAQGYTFATVPELTGQPAAQSPHATGAACSAN